MTSPEATEVAEQDVCEHGKGSPEASRPAGRYVAWILLAFAINLSITYILTDAFGYSRETAFLIALIAITAFNFFGLRGYVYRARHESLLDQAWKYIATNILHRSAEWLAFAAIDRVASPPVFVTVPIVLGASTLIRYIVYQRYVFRRRHRSEQAVS